jgi:branched-chain amino acid transport system permease protein
MVPLMDQTVLVQAVFSGLLQAGLLAAVAIGLALVFGVLGVVNFAHGALLMVAMYGAVLLGGGVPAWAASLILGGAMAAVGVVLYVGIIKPSYHLDHTFHLLITLGVAVILENGALLLFGGRSRGLPDIGVGGKVTVLGASLPGDRIVLFAIACGICAALYALLTRTDLGHQIRAASQDAAAAELTGIPVDRVMAISMALGVGVLGVIGPWVLTVNSVQPGTGDTFVLLAFVIVILGGLGSIRGALVASVIVGLTQSLGAAVLPGTLGISAVWILFVAVLLVRPRGLMAGRA